MSQVFPDASAVTADARIVEVMFHSHVCALSGGTTCHDPGTSQAHSSPSGRSWDKNPGLRFWEQTPTLGPEGWKDLCSRGSFVKQLPQMTRQGRNQLLMPPPPSSPQMSDFHLPFQLLLRGMTIRSKEEVTHWLDCCHGCCLRSWSFVFFIT